MAMNANYLSAAAAAAAAAATVIIMTLGCTLVLALAFGLLSSDSSEVAQNTEDASGWSFDITDNGRIAFIVQVTFSIVLPLVHGAVKSCSDVAPERDADRSEVCARTASAISGAMQMIAGMAKSPNAAIGGLVATYVFCNSA